MTGNRNVEAYPLFWPEGWKRIPGHQRKDSPFAVTFDTARNDLFRQLEKLGAKRAILSTNIPVRLDGIPYATQTNPSDPGVALYFEYKGASQCFACDKFKTVLENIRAIGLTIASIRAIERYGASEMMERAFRGFTALPQTNAQHWREILDLPRDGAVSVDQVESQFRSLVKVMHPDVGGSPEGFQQLVIARENARKDLGIVR